MSGIRIDAYIPELVKKIVLITFKGDSGGPIQVTTSKNLCVSHIVGVTSFGKACAAKNTVGVYTRVSSYLDWIERIVWP